MLKAMADNDHTTALGILGPPAKEAIPALEKLAEHEAPQIAERAKAALRQVVPGTRDLVPTNSGGFADLVGSRDPVTPLVSSA